VAFFLRFWRAIPKLALNWVCIGFATLDFGPKLALIGFELALNWVCFLA